MPRPIIYLDMDGVLVDFVRGALEHHNHHIADGEVMWDFNKQLGISDQDFWDPMGRDFWANLPWTPEGEAILGGIIDRFGGDNILILSSPCKTAGCAEGKLDWIRKHIPEFSRKYLFGPNKHLCASPKHLLIDDYDHNIDRFRMYGGQGCLVPRSWNTQCHLTDRNRFDVVAFLQRVETEALRCTTG